MEAQSVERQGFKRRGILAAAGAVVAGIVAKQTSQPVRAVSDTNYIATGGSGTAFSVATSSYGTGVSATGSTYGVYSSTATGYGVFSVTTGSGAGIYGGAGGSGSYGVHGVSSGAGLAGVKGESGTDGGVGVRGEIPALVGFAPPMPNTAANTIAVQGINQSTGAGGVGVYGQCDKGYGVLGFSTGGSASISGISTNVNIPAFAGGNSVAGGLAASFAGTVYVNGMFVVADMTQKHGLLKHPDGSHRLMYSVEAPESWAEDFGTGNLVGGRADVKLDPDFAALIHTEDYLVFVTGRDDSNGLYVTGHSATGFTVREHKGGVSNLTFSWRVVAKPKSEHKVERLGKFVVPNVPLPDVTTLPKPETHPVPKQP